MENKTTEQDSVKIRQAKEFDSFCKKVRVNNRIWFDALSKTKRYDLFYEWRRESYNSIEKKKHVMLKGWRIEIVLYPAKLKHFIKEKKKEFRYQPKKSNLRESAIDFILDKK
jgi:hypothetical protein